jgi:hypothetical protein
MIEDAVSARHQHLNRCACESSNCVASHHMHTCICRERERVGSFHTSFKFQMVNCDEESVAADL